MTLKKVIIILWGIWMNTLFCQNLPTASFVVSTHSICLGDSVSCSDSSSNNPFLWIWNAPGASIQNPSTPTPALSYTSAGIYTISLSVINSGGTSTNVAIQTITIFSNPTITAIYQPTFLCKYKVYTVTLSAQGASTYYWNAMNQFGSGQTVTITVANSGTIFVTGTDTNGRSNTFSKGIKTSICEYVGLNKHNKENGWIIFPNPVSQILNITSHQSKIGEYILLDTFGYSVMCGLVEERTKLDLSLLKCGLYYLKIKDENIADVYKIMKD